MKGDLKDLVHELDFKVGGFHDILSDLSDAEILFNQLRDKMNDALYKGEEMIYYHEHSRMVRVLSSLFRYVLDDLCTEVEKTEEIKDQIFEKVVKSHSAGNTVASEK